MDEQSQLSRRERQIMDIIFARGGASATQVLEAMGDPPSRTAVRTLLTILESKGHLTHTKRSREFIYQPTRPRQRVGQSAFRRVLNTFFDGSLQQALAAHLADPGAQLSPKERNRLEELIRQAGNEGE